MASSTATSAAQRLRRVGGGGPVHRHQQVARRAPGRGRAGPGGPPRPGRTCRLASSITSPTWWTPSVMPSRGQVLDGGVGGAQQQGRQVVGDDAVLLLGHRAVERAQAGLDVADRQVELRGGERARQRRGGVAVDEHHVRGLGDQQGLEPLQHHRELGDRAARAHLEGVVGLRARPARRRTGRRGRGRSAGRCGPAPRRRGARSARLSGAAFTNCGRLPTIETTFKCPGTPRPRAAG